MCVLLTFLRSSCSPALVAPPLFRSSSHRRPSRCRPPHRCSCCRSHPHRFTSGLSSHRSSFVVALARRRLCPTAHGCPVAPLRRSTRWHCQSAIPPISHLNPLPRMRSAPVLPPTTACSSANDARLSVTSVSPPLRRPRPTSLPVSPPALLDFTIGNDKTEIDLRPATCATFEILKDGN